MLKPNVNGVSFTSEIVMQCLSAVVTPLQHTAATSSTLPAQPVFDSRPCQASYTGDPREAWYELVLV